MSSTGALVIIASAAAVMAAALEPATSFGLLVAAGASFVEAFVSWQAAKVAALREDRRE